VPGEGNLGRGREDADADVRVGLRRQHEDGLAELRLARERLHGVGVEVAPVGEDGELVPLERRVREDVADDVAEGGHGPTLAVRNVGTCRNGLNMKNNATCELTFALKTSLMRVMGNLRGTERTMPVAITVTWNFSNGDENVEIAYGASHEDVPASDNDLNGVHVDEQVAVVPLTSSVIAPGLSMPVAAR
jgi:hypothetical protein